MMRLLESLALSMIAVVAAGSASATVTVDHVGSSGIHSLLLGETFTVDVFLTWSGGASAAGLQGMSSSTSFDSSMLEFVSADWLGVGETAPSIFEGNSSPPLVLPGLSRLGGLRQPGDPDAILRTVSYASASPASLEGQRRELITTLTFRLIGSGSTEIRALLWYGDSGAIGGTNPFLVGTSVSVTYIPEPGSAWLIALGLAGLTKVGRPD